MDAYLCDHRDRSADALSSSSFSSLSAGGFGFLKVIVFRMVASVVSFSWFCIQKGFVFLVWFVSTLLFRINARISSRRDGCRSLLTEESETERPILDALAFDEMSDKDFVDDDREDSSFKFQFKFDFPEDIRRSMEKQHRTEEVFEVADVTDGPEQSPVDKKVPSEPATMINNYMFLSEKNITGFVVEPEEVTCRYQESFVVEHDDDHLQVSEELDRELRARLFSLKRFNYADEDAACNSESIAKKSKRFSLPNTDDLYYMDDLVGKKGFKISNDDESAVTSEFRVEELRGFYQSNSDEGTAATASHVPMDEEKSNMVEPFFDEMMDEIVMVLNSDESDPVVLSKLEYGGSKKSRAVAMDHEARSVEEKGLSSEKDFDATRSDSNSLTCSDGYSVKSLELFTDSGKESPCPTTVLMTTPDVYKDSESLDSSQLEDDFTNVSQPVAMNSKVRLVGGGNIPCRSSEEIFDAMASYSYSPTSSYSDGYSVKSLEMVTESDDGFLSDRDVSRSRCVNFDEVSLTSPVGEQQNRELSECFENYVADSVNEFSNELDQFNVGAKEVNQVIQEADLVISRLSSINLPEPELGDFSEIDLHINNLDCTQIDDEYPLNHVPPETDNYTFDYKLHEFDGEEEALPENLQVEETLLQRSLSLDEEFTILENGSMPMSVTRNRNSNKIFHKQGSPDQDHGDSSSSEEEEELVASFLSKDDEGKRWHPPGSIGLAKRGLNERQHSDEVESKKVMFTSSEVHSRKCSPEIQSEGVFQNLDQNAKDFHEEDVLEKKDLRFYEEVIPEKRSGLVKGDFDELEAIWDDHQDLIQQLSMDLINGKTIALPTIPEEPESPGLVEDLKKWNFNVVFLHEQPIDEMHKMYKKYKDGMRKLDILNNQKMHAIDLLHLKDTFQSTSSQKPSITSLLSQSFFPCQRRKSNNDHLEKFIRELHNDLEVVYVGQTCLSWEFLSWQFEKSQELPVSDPYRSRQYNRVADEFQNFLVLIQRFVENEPSQVPRVSYYVKSRHDLCNLLQVPVIKEDCLKDKVELKKNDNKSIMFEELENIMAKSIRSFWQFVKADKDKTSRILKELFGIQAELQEPADLELMVDIHADLRKKQKKLKDILKIGNCLVKKFKKPNEQRSSQDLFFSQVDLKLVSRVLEMPRITTDQLVWCYHKLKNITFVDRKIHREPSFFVFPCSA